MHISEFNQIPLVQAQTILKQCVNIPSWMILLSEHRPYESKHSLIQLAQQQTSSWTWQEVKTSLNSHPRIGEKQAQQKLSAKEQSLSDREQVGVSQDQTTLDALHEANLSYEAKFGFIFLIKAAGLTSEDILEKMQQRLQNDIETEKDIVKQQLAEIAILRLDQEIES